MGKWTIARYLVQCNISLAICSLLFYIKPLPHIANKEIQRLILIVSYSFITVLQYFFSSHRAADRTINPCRASRKRVTDCLGPSGLPTTKHPFGLFLDAISPDHPAYQDRIRELLLLQVPGTGVIPCGFRTERLKPASACCPWTFDSGKSRKTRRISCACTRNLPALG